MLALAKPDCCNRPVLIFSEHLVNEIPGKTVVACFHRSMRGKHAAAAHDFDVRFHSHRVLAKLELLLEHRQREERGMPFVHVIAADVRNVQMPQQA